MIYASISGKMQTPISVVGTMQFCFGDTAVMAPGALLSEVTADWYVTAALFKYV